MDPISTVGAGLAVLGSKDILTKVLGPTADYVGGELKGLIDKCNINLDQIFVKAKKKLGDGLEEDGIVSPRVLKSVLDEGRFCEDELAAEYYGGVLASSKMKSNRDDRGVALMELIKRLSVYQLRLHYLFYYLIKEHGNENERIGVQKERRKNRIFIPFSVYIDGMEFTEEEEPSVILSHSIAGLLTNGLIGDDYQFGAQDHIKPIFSECPEYGGIVLTPTVLGAELFLWAEGVNSIDAANILSSDFKKPKSIIPIVEGSIKI